MIDLLISVTYALINDVILAWEMSNAQLSTLLVLKKRNYRNYGSKYINFDFKMN